MLPQFALHYFIINSKFGAIKAIFFKIIQTDGVYKSISNPETKNIQMKSEG